MVTMVILAAVLPPVMNKVQIAPPATPNPAKRIEITVHNATAVMMLPAKWKPQRKQTVFLHFHGPDWHTINEFDRAGFTLPVVNFAVGQGSTVYGNLFRPKEAINDWMTAIRDQLSQAANIKDLEITKLHLSSFSAGYGAIRELLQDPPTFAKIATVVLCDSMYASLATKEPRTVLQEHTDVWVPIAKKAMSKKAKFALAVSMVPTPEYASSSECADALAKTLGVEWKEAESTNPATKDPDFPLLKTAEKGFLYLWQYGGSGPDAHMTHARHLADIWRAIGLKP